MMMPGNNGYRARQQPVNDSGIDEAASHLGDTDVDLSPLTDHSHGRSFEEVEGSQNSLPNYDTVPSSVPHENHNVPNTSQGAGAAAAATTLNAPPEWEDLAPDVVIRCIKKIPAQELATIGMREYYKSYPVWQRMTVDQRNRAIAWFRQLPEDWQGKYLVMARFVLACISSICAHILISAFQKKSFLMPLIPLSSWHRKRLLLRLLPQRTTLLGLYIYLRSQQHRHIGPTCTPSYLELTWMPGNRLMFIPRELIHLSIWQRSSTTTRRSDHRTSWLSMLIMGLLDLLRKVLT